MIVYSTMQLVGNNCKKKLKQSLLCQYEAILLKYTTSNAIIFYVSIRFL